MPHIFCVEMHVIIFNNIYGISAFYLHFSIIVEQNKLAETAKSFAYVVKNGSVMFETDRTIKRRSLCVFGKFKKLIV